MGMWMPKRVTPYLAAAPAESSCVPVAFFWACLGFFFLSYVHIWERFQFA